MLSSVGRKAWRLLQPCSWCRWPNTPRAGQAAITGSGAASKEQVAGMVQRTLQIAEAMPRHLDATDARWRFATCTGHAPGGGAVAAFVRENLGRAR